MSGTSCILLYIFSDRCLLYMWRALTRIEIAILRGFSFRLEKSEFQLSVSRGKSSRFIGYPATPLPVLASPPLPVRHRFRSACVSASVSPGTMTISAGQTFLSQPVPVAVMTDCPDMFFTVLEEKDGSSRFSPPFKFNLVRWGGALFLRSKAAPPPSPHISRRGGRVV